jgi:hypothetical protein
MSQVQVRGLHSGIERCPGRDLQHVTGAAGTSMNFTPFQQAAHDVLPYKANDLSC